MDKCRALSFTFFFFISLLILQETVAKGCTEVPVGLTSREQFPDYYFTASSSYSDQHLPLLARINSHSSWTPALQDNPNDFLQIDLGVDYHICAISTKGAYRDAGWVSRYKLAFSSDSKDWTTFKVKGKQKIFFANRDQHNSRKNILFPHPTARFIRVYPTRYHKWKSLRIELYGYKLDNCKNPLGFENYGIDNSQITVSSELLHQHGRYGGHFARLHHSHSWRSTDDPSTKTQEYIEVDLGQMKTVAGIATQGDPREKLWVTSYNLEFKKYGGDWYEYTPSRNKESFEGNTDNNGLVLHWFDVKHHVRYVRVLPKTWNKGIALRMELYGCEVSCENQPIGIKNRDIISDAAMTLSSRRSNTAHAHQGRLQYILHDSWCASLNDKQPYLQIDLGAAHVICAVETQGNSKADNWVEIYMVKISMDGKDWKNYEEDYSIKNFTGNFDRNSLSKNVLNNSPLAQFIRFVPLKSHGGACMRVEVHGTSHDACSKTITGASATGQIPDYRFTASSSYTNYKPFHGRLHGPYSWTAEENDANDYFQVDLGDPHILCGVATQGSGRNSEKVLSYYVQLSMDGFTWDFYENRQGHKKIFEASGAEEVTAKRHLFTNIRTAKFVRFIPLTYYSSKSMRAEMYGLRQGWRGSLGVEAGLGKPKIPDNHLSSSSNSDPDHVESEGRLYGSSSWCTQDSHHPYFEVDLGRAKEVVAIATQGDPTRDYFVKRYHVHYGFTSDRWMKVENVQGNTDSNTVRVFWFKPTVSARYIRLLPVDWNGLICMRVDVYGNNQVPPPKLTESKITGKLVALPSSHVTIRCLATADSNLHFKWFSSAGDVTNKSSGNVYDRGQVFSKLQVNYTSDTDVLSHYPCVSINQSTSRCQMTFMCQALYGEVRGERKEHVIDIEITKVSKPTLKIATQSPTKQYSRARTIDILTDEAFKSSAPQTRKSFLWIFTFIFFPPYLLLCDDVAS